MKIVWGSQKLLLVLALATLGEVAIPQVSRACHTNNMFKDNIGCDSRGMSTSTVPALQSLTKVKVTFLIPNFDVIIEDDIFKDTSLDDEQTLLLRVKTAFPTVQWTIHEKEENWGTDGERTYTFFIKSLSQQRKKNFLKIIYTRMGSITLINNEDEEQE